MGSTPANDIAAIPGDPGGIRRRANKFNRMAEAISEAREMLASVARDAENHDSEAVDELAKGIGNSRERLEDLRSRYEVAGSQLATFADVLSNQQDRANEAVAARDTQLPNRRYYQRRYEEMLHEAQHGPIDQRPDAAREATRYQRLRDDANLALGSAGTKHYNAVEAVRVAGDSAAEAIAKAVNGDGVNDSAWDRITGAMKDWVSANAGWLSSLKNILGALTAIVGIASIFFPVLAPIALGLAGATALLSFTLAAAGEGSWLDFGLDMLGVLTFGVGAVFARGVGLAIRGSRIARGLNHNRQMHSFGQRVIHPIRTRRDAIARVTDEFQSVLPAGQQLVTRMPTTTLTEKFSRTWLELSGRQVSQYQTIVQQAQLGANGFRAQFIQGLGDAAVSGYKGTQAFGAAQDVATLGLTGVERYHTEYVAGPGDSGMPWLDSFASGWQDVKTTTTVEVGTNWRTGEQ